MASDFKAVHADEMRGFFSRIGKLKELEAGDISCEECTTVLSLSNFGAVYKENGQLRFLCSRSSCLARSRKVSLANGG